MLLILEHNFRGPVIALIGPSNVQGVPVNTYILLTISLPTILYNILFYGFWKLA